MLRYLAVILREWSGYEVGREVLRACSVLGAFACPHRVTIQKPVALEQVVLYNAKVMRSRDV